MSNSDTYRCLWDDEPSSRVPELASPDDGYDVVIVGAGFTGLWTALYLTDLNPQLSIAIIDRERAGFGASGRNGGWCSAMLPMGMSAIARMSSVEQAVAMQTAMNDTVAHIGRETDRLGISCDYSKGGTIEVARSIPQLERARHRVHSSQDHPCFELRLLDSHQVARITGVSRALGGVFDPFCAALHPGKLVRGLAEVVRLRGVQIVEHCRVYAIESHRVHLEDRVIEAKVIVRATEGFTSSLRKQRRELLPIHSLMIATEPLEQRQLNEVGLTDRTTFSDGRHMIVYGQRTADGRIAFGGRGAPYHFGSSTDLRHSTSGRVADMLRETLIDMFPSLASTRFTHHWGGPLGAARDWQCSVSFDAKSGLAAAGGYVGDGVATTNLAGRTIAHLIVGTDDPITRLPWVGHRSRRWEPEPIRWMAVNAMTAVARMSDSQERRRNSEARIMTAVLDRLTGG